MFGWIVGIVAAAAIIYLGIGAVMAWYESSQTDDPFKKMLVLTWAYHMFKR